MKISKLFQNSNQAKIEKKIEDFLSNQRKFLIKENLKSEWKVRDLLEKNFDKILGNLSKDYSSSFARRAMADLAFTDKDGFYYVVDVKTHRLDTKFNMPNLTSVERLARFYEDDSNYFVVLKVDYEIKKTRVVIKKATFVPIEFLSWNCLTIGALGWGQIQIANANFVEVIPKNSRKKWMLELCDNLFEFYPREIGKINDRIVYFKKVKKYWKNKKD